MNKLLTTLIASSLALASSMQAQEAEPSPTPGKKQSGKEQPAVAPPAKKASAANKPKAKEARPPAPEAPPVKKAQPPTKAKRLPESDSTPKPRAKAKTPVAPESASSTPSTPAAPVVKKTVKPEGAKPETATAEAPAGKRKKNRDVAAETETPTKPSKSTPPAPATETASAPAPDKERSAKKNARAKKPDVQTIKKIKTEHASFKAQPKPDRVPTVTFTANRRLEGSDQWEGENYGVYRAYRPERHGRDYYHSRYTRVELISGGYYYWNAGYWYPAWGYDTAQQYYAYDAPIYAGQRAEPLDRIIADVQAVLQQQGYYTGEVDGLLGPLTREALVGYQNDNGLYRTAVIDEPTLTSLGMG